MSGTNMLTRLRTGLSYLQESHRLHLLLLVITGGALYLSTLTYPFVFDDRVFIMNNPLIRHSAGFLDLFDINDFLPEYLPRINDPDMVTSFALRPVAYITFRLNYLLGGDNPAGYRAVNIAIHIANALMLYRLLLCIVRQRTGAEFIRQHLSIPFFAAFFFLVHPLQTESVTYVTQRFTSLGVFFYCATVLLYLQTLTCKSRMTKRLVYLASVISLLLGMLTKEFVFTAPLSLILIEYFLLRKSLYCSFRRHIPHLTCLVVIPAILFTLSYDLNGQGLSVGSATAISNFNGFTRAEYGITQLRVILSYFRLLVLPYNLNFDPDYPLYNSVTNPEILLSILVWGMFLTAVIVILKKKNRDIFDDLVVFSIIWFPLLLAVSSSVVPLPDLMSEHRTYLPSLAFCTGTTAYLHSLFRRSFWKLPASVFAGGCVVLALFGTLTIMRNQVYSSRLSLWSDTAAKNPGKARPALALGNIYQEMGRNELAEAWLARAVELKPDYTESYLSLGSMYLDQGRNPEAIGLYEKYLEFYLPERRILSNLALAYSNAGMPVEAIATLKIALKLDPDDETLNLIMAEHLLMLDQDEEARLYLAKVTELDEDNPLVNISEQIRMLQERYLDEGVPVKVPNTGQVRS